MKEEVRDLERQQYSPCLRDEMCRPDISLSFLLFMFIYIFVKFY